jgi:hypothetical protein
MSATSTTSAFSLLAARFHNPPRDVSPVPLWWWSGERLDPARLRWQLERFAEGGVYNLVVMNLAPTGPLYGCDADDPPFFSVEWWRLFRGACEDAEKLGIKLWFYDQLGFSGANLQGELVKAEPLFAGQTLGRIVRDMSGPGVLRCPAAGAPISAAAVPLDPDGHCVGAPMVIPLHDGQVEWAAAGLHRVMLFYHTTRGFDYFNPTACRRLVATVHEAFEEHVGDLFGRVIAGSFQDELPALPTWSRDFAERFRARCGYDLASSLALLWGEGNDAGAVARVRGDYHATRAALAEDAFFQPLHAWHEERGLLCGFDQQHPARAGFPVEGVQLYADYMRTHRWFSAPGSDHHGEAKLHASLAHLYDRPRVWIEAFHSSGWGGTLEEMFDWLLPWLRAGATLYDPHAVYYSTRGGWWEWAPPATDWRQPYWRHYSIFARAVSRLCAALTVGHHVCDIGVLYPNATVQAGLSPDGPDAMAQAAHDTYLRLVGVMHWAKVELGVLDRLRRDYDVLDDASVQRGEARDGRLRIGEESFAVIILPSCTVVEEETAVRLAAFVEAGGTLVAVGARPHLVTGQRGQDAPARALTTLIALFDAGRAQHVACAEDLAATFSGVPVPVDAPVPTLVRRVGEATVLFVPAAFPRATRMRSEEEQGRSPADDGLSFAWLDIDYTFDTDRYSREMTLTVRGVRGAPEVWEPCSGARRRLEASPTMDGQGMTVHLPFLDGPGVLLVWPGAVGDDASPPRVGDRPAHDAVEARAEALAGAWAMDLEPTLDNRWGDFAFPAGQAPIPLERWAVRHRVDSTGTTSLDEGWRRPEYDDAHWPVAHATYGPHGYWSGPATLDRLPEPLASPDSWHTWQVEGGVEWREVVYSRSRGIDKDPVHRRTLGPKGHVPEEFLRFGPVRRGDAVQVRAAILPPAHPGEDLYLAVGAAAHKHVWLNGVEQATFSRDAGYLSIHPVALDSERNVVELRLQPEDDCADLRAYIAVVREPQTFARPEWMMAGGDAAMDATIVYARQWTLPFDPQRAVIQVGAIEPCRVRVNGVEVGRHGGFDPYAERAEPRLQPYEIAHALTEGDNVIEIDVTEHGSAGTALVDAVAEGGGERSILCSDATWSVLRDGRPVDLTLRRMQWVDPGHAHVWRRPHPLPAARWLEGPPTAETVVPVIITARTDHRPVEWMRFVVPPGARRMALRLHGTATVYVDGEQLSPGPRRDTTGMDDGTTMLDVELPRARAERRICALRIDTEPGFEAGAILDAPIQFEMGRGTINLGNWADHGLEGYSGGVRYSRTFIYDADTRLGGRVLLDLGRVRGTAEVRVNDAVIGARIWAPYTFDLTGRLQHGENTLDVIVYNTLAPYLAAVSPTFYVFPGQTVSGLFGPVVITGV